MLNINMKKLNNWGKKKSKPINQYSHHCSYTIDWLKTLWKCNRCQRYKAGVSQKQTMEELNGFGFDL